MSSIIGDSQIQRPKLHSVIHACGHLANVRSKVDALLKDDEESWKSDDESSDDGEWSVESDETECNELDDDDEGEALCSDPDDTDEDDYVYVPRPSKRRRAAADHAFVC